MQDPSHYTWTLYDVAISGMPCYMCSPHTPSTGLDAYADWSYCVNYSAVGTSAMEKMKCTNELKTTLTSLESDTLYRFVVSARGPGGERVSPDVLVFRTKPVGKFYTCEHVCVCVLYYMYVYTRMHVSPCMLCLGSLVWLGHEDQATYCSCNIHVLVSRTS